MKTIKFIKIEFENFKCFRHEEFSFGDGVTIVKGKNGIGKTTIAEGITWALFGKDLDGATNFGLKTRVDGEELKEVPHSVTLHLAINGETHTVKRMLTDKVKDGSVSNTYSFYIDGEKLTAGDFKKAIDGIVSETVFRLTTSPTAFTSLPWEQQRQVIATLAGEISPDEITNGDHKYDFVVKETQKKAIEDVVRHCKYAKGEVQKELDKIPTRLAELDKALPDVESVDYTEEDVDDDIKRLTKQLSDIRSGGSDKVIKDGIRNKLDFANKRKDNMERSARNKASELMSEHYAELDKASALVSDAKKLVDDLQNKKNSISVIISKCNERINECEQEKVKGSEEWARITSQQWEWDDKSSFCPTCGQPLPADRLLEMMHQSKERFNDRIAGEKKACREKAAKISEQIKEAKSEIETYEEELSSSEAQLVKAQKDLMEKEQAYEQIKEASVPSYEDIIHEKLEYVAVCDEIATLEKQLYETPTVGIDKELEEKIVDELSQAEQCKRHLATITAQETERKRIQGLIDIAKEDKRVFQTQLDELEERLDIATDYYYNSCRILEDKVNEHFSYVKWSMFRTNLDGTKKPYCECSHNGIPFGDLNTASKIKAGIDICHTIAEHYGVNVPVIIDNAESICNILRFDGDQQIRLYVVDGQNKLDFDYDD